MTTFEGVVPALEAALIKRGYTELTSVQRSVIEPDLIDSDALVSAQTGSGKTVAFGLAMAPNLLQGQDKFLMCDKPLALVVAPTRELALQVQRELQWLYAETGARFASCVGGMDARKERRALEQGAHIVVGTPGRLCDHIRRGALDTTELKVAVLDEADEMLDLGFRDDLEFILETTPAERRTLLFSATVPNEIAKMAKRYQRDAVRISTKEEKSQHVDIEYRVLGVAPRERENAIFNVLRYYDADNALVFCNTRASVNHMTARLNNRGFSVVALSGELSQEQRSYALQALRDGRAKVCVATDVAARGIDLPKLELVIHAELPTNPETLLHRSGRTGRAGRKGISALIADTRTRSKAERLLRFAKIQAEWVSPPNADDILAKDEQRILDDIAAIPAADEDDAAFIQRMLTENSAEKIAGAYLALKRIGQAPPEDLNTINWEEPAARKGSERDFDDRPPKGKPADFAKSAWVKLSVGRKQRAEPRWLIPLLCNAAGITKRDIGTITMHADETHVQLDASRVEEFLSNTDGQTMLERDVRMDVLDGQPSKPAPSGDSPRNDRPRRDSSRKDGPKKSFRERPHSEERFDKPKKRFAKTEVADSRDKPRDERPPARAPRDERAPAPERTREPYRERTEKSETEKKPFVKADHKPAGAPFEGKKGEGKKKSGKKAPWSAAKKREAKKAKGK